MAEFLFENEAIEIIRGRKRSVWEGACGASLINPGVERRIMRFHCGRVLILMVLLVAVTAGFAGQKRVSKEPPLKDRSPKAENAYDRVSIFRDEDRSMIRRYYTDHYANLPPGLAKRGGDLPPGLQKQLRRNGQLPPGLEKRLQPFPRDLEQKLPSLRSGLTRGVIGRSALIIDESSSLILDVLSLE
jgi:hypothetical protein